MKEKIRRVLGVLCLAVFALSVLFFLFTIFDGGWLFLVLGAPFLLAGVLLLRKEMSASPVENNPAPEPAPRPAPSAPVKEKSSAPYEHKVAGISNYLEAVEALAVPNDDYNLTRRELVDNEMEDVRIWKDYFPVHKTELIPEPDNPYDPNAIKVVADGHHIGYIKAGSCAHVHRLLRETRIQDIICRVGGGPYKVVTVEYDDLGEKETYHLEKDTVPYYARVSIIEKPPEA